MAAAYYFIDYTNGNDAQTGLRIPAGDQNSTSYYTIDSTADTTHFVDASLTGADDYINGSYVYNVTRGIGALITDFVASTDTVTLGSAIAGMTAGDSYYILDSWKTINKYTTTTTRTAGDFAYLRANMTHTQGAVDISADEAGSATSRISIVGCNATQGIDPWHDASDTRPIIDFAAGAYKYYHTQAFWAFKNLRVTNSTHSLGVLYLNTPTGCIIQNSVVDTNSNATSAALYLGTCSDLIIQGTSVSNAKVYSCYIDGGYNIIFEDFGTTHCTFDSGANATTYCLSAPSSSDIYLNNCVFGATTVPATAYIRASRGENIILRNATFTGATTKIYSSSPIYAIREEDTVSYGTQTTTYYQGVLTKDATARTGGSAASARLIPNTNCGPNLPLTINDIFTSDFLVWCPAWATTITVYMRAYGTWSTYPTASQLWIEANYLSVLSPITRTTSTASTQVLSDTTTWVAFTTTFTPAQASWVEVKVKLAKYQDANTGVYVDIRPVVS